MPTAVFPYIGNNKVFIQTSNAAPTTPDEYWFTIGATFQAGTITEGSAVWPGHSATLSFHEPTRLDYYAPAPPAPFKTLDALHNFFPFGTYTVGVHTDDGELIASNIFYNADYFTNDIPYITNYSSLQGFNPLHNFQ